MRYARDRQGELVGAMLLPQFQLLRPATLDEALAVLAREGESASILAGGTDLLVSMRQRLVAPRTLVALDRVPGLAEVREAPDGGVLIGGGCILSDLIAHPLLATRYPALVAAIRAVGSQHVRNMATLGGNLALPTRCWYTNQSEEWRGGRQACWKTSGELCHVIKTSTTCRALNSADTAPALMALGAVLQLAGAGGERELPLLEFYRDDGVQPTRLAAGELICAIRVPPPEGRSAFLKVAQRTGLDYGLATLGARVSGSNRRVREACLVAGAVGSRPIRLQTAEARIVGQPLNAETIEAAAQAARADLGEVTNLFSPAGYKKRVVRGLVRRLLTGLRKQPVARKAAAP